MADDTTIYYCRACGWRNEPLYQGVMVNQCPQCGQHGLSFVTYKRGIEEASAEAVIAGKLRGDL